MADEHGLVLGIDGGGTSTRAVLADLDGNVLGRGEAGPGNPKSAGLDVALEEFQRAIEGAYSAAQRKAAPVDAICLALAGAGRAEDRPPIEEWARAGRVAETVAIVADAVAVLAAAAPEIIGVSMIAGTGSMVYGRDQDGSETRAGGWGALFGDEGSGYVLAVAGLRAAVRAFDGRGPSTTLLPAFLDRLKLTEAGGLVTTLYSPGWDKRRIAALATVVTTCADGGDDIANGLLQDGAEELTKAAVAVAERLAWNAKPMVAMAGGLIANAAGFRGLLETSLAQSQHFGRTVLVTEPALGSVAIARRLAEGKWW